MSGKAVGHFTVSRLVAILLLAMLAGGCVTTRPSETLPVVEIEINNTPTHRDDIASIFGQTPTPARMRIAAGYNVPAQVPVAVTNIALCGTYCGKLRFAASTTGPAANVLYLTLPGNGAWVPFVVRGDPAAASQTAKDAVMQVSEDRTDGVVLARQGLHVSDASTIWTQTPSAIIDMDETPYPLDDYLTWAPKKASIRLVTPNGLTAPLTAIIRNAAPAAGADPPGRLVFGLPVAGGGPPATSTMTPTLPVSLPANGTPVRFYAAGEFSEPSLRDKDAIIEVFNPGESNPQKTIIETHGVMVRIRKNANTLGDHERYRFLLALQALNYLTPRYAPYVQINSQAGTRANSAGQMFNASSPAYLPWHRLLILRLERELQALDPSVALPYWRYDQPAPKVFHPDFMGVSQPSSPFVTLNFGNPLYYFAWTPKRMSSFLPSQSPSTTGPAACRPATEATILGLGSNFRSGNPFTATMGFMTVEWLASDRAVHAAAGDCTGGTATGDLASPATAVQDPLYFLLYANTDRLWAKWQKQEGRFNPALPGSYAAVVCGGSPSGQCLTDTMWPWNSSTAPGGRFPISLGRLLLPPDQPAPWNALSIDRAYFKDQNGQWQPADIGLGYSYDDTLPTH